MQRPLWREYYQNTSVLIFVVDSSDRERISESRDELRKLLAEEELKNCVLLVMANKQDLPNVMSIADITDGLQLAPIIQNRSWRKLMEWVIS